MDIIPTFQESEYREQITLDGVIFVLVFNWNSLNEYWTMSILNQSEQPIVNSIKIVTQFDLTSQIVQFGMPKGSILCQNIVNVFDRIQRNDLGLTNELVYYSEAELALLNG